MDYQVENITRLNGWAGAWNTKNWKAERVIDSVSLDIVYGGISSDAAQPSSSQSLSHYHAFGGAESRTDGWTGSWDSRDWHSKSTKELIRAILAAQAACLELLSSNDTGRGTTWRNTLSTENAPSTSIQASQLHTSAGTSETGSAVIEPDASLATNAGSSASSTAGDWQGVAASFVAGSHDYTTSATDYVGATSLRIGQLFETAQPDGVASVILSACATISESSAPSSLQTVSLSAVAAYIEDANAGGSSSANNHAVGSVSDTSLATDVGLSALAAVASLSDIAEATVSESGAANRIAGNIGFASADSSISATLLSNPSIEESGAPLHTQAASIAAMTQNLTSVASSDSSTAIALIIADVVNNIDAAGDGSFASSLRVVGLLDVLDAIENVNATLHAFCIAEEPTASGGSEGASLVTNAQEETASTALEHTSAVSHVIVDTPESADENEDHPSATSWRISGQHDASEATDERKAALHAVSGIAEATEPYEAQMVTLVAVASYESSIDALSAESANNIAVGNAGGHTAAEDSAASTLDAVASIICTTDAYENWVASAFRIADRTDTAEAGSIHSVTLHAYAVSKEGVLQSVAQSANSFRNAYQVDAGTAVEWQYASLHTSASGTADANPTETASAINHAAACISCLTESVSTQSARNDAYALQSDSATSLATGSAVRTLPVSEACYSYAEDTNTASAVILASSNELSGVMVAASATAEMVAETTERTLLESGTSAIGHYPAVTFEDAGINDTSSSRADFIAVSRETSSPYVSMVGLGYRIAGIDEAGRSESVESGKGYVNGITLEPTVISDWNVGGIAFYGSSFGHADIRDFCLVFQPHEPIRVEGRKGFVAGDTPKRSWNVTGYRVADSGARAKHGWKVSSDRRFAVTAESKDG